MNALTIFADVVALFVLMWAIYVVVRFIVTYPRRYRVDEWEREHLEGR